MATAWRSVITRRRAGGDPARPSWIGSKAGATVVGSSSSYSSPCRSAPKTEVLVFGCTDGRESIAWNAHLGRHPVRVARRRRRIARELELPILERGDSEVQVRRDLRLGRAPPGACDV